MAIENVIGSWKEVRSGLIDEATQIPADHFSFRAAPDCRPVKELLQHLVAVQKFLTGEICRPDTNLMRGSCAEQVKNYAPNDRSIEHMDALLDRLRTTRDASGAKLQ